MKHQLQSGDIIASRYKIVRLLGEGGMAQVYLAWDLNLCREIALKTIRLDQLHNRKKTETLKERLLREARAAAQLNHHNVIVIHDLGETENIPYISMEYIEGKTLRQFIGSRPEISLGEILDIGDQIAAGIDYAHSKNVVHRDIKPENILLNKENIPKISDFGIARVESAGQTTLTTEGKLICTYHYTAPECFEGKKADKRSDVFSFGCVVYELLTGHIAFEGDTEPRIWWKIIHEEPVDISRMNSDFPPKSNEAIRRMLHKFPSKRPAGCGEGMKLLRSALSGMESQKVDYRSHDIAVSGTPGTESDSPSDPGKFGLTEKTRSMLLIRRKRLFRGFMIGILLGLVIGIGAWFLGKSNQSSGQDARIPAVDNFESAVPESPVTLSSSTVTATATREMTRTPTASQTPETVAKTLLPTVSTRASPTPSPLPAPAGNVLMKSPTPTPLPANTRTPTITRIATPESIKTTPAMTVTAEPWHSPAVTDVIITPSPVSSFEIVHSKPDAIELGESLELSVEISPDDPSVNVFGVFLGKRRSTRRFEFTLISDGIYRLEVSPENLPDKKVKYCIVIERDGVMVETTENFVLDVREPWIPF